MQQTILITGANGFLAQAVATRLPSDWQSIALIKPGTSSQVKRHSRTFNAWADLSRSIQRIDVVFHLAACIPQDYNLPNTQLLSVNVDLVSRLIAEYPEARHVYASSVAVYGHPQGLPLTVDSPGHQVSRYGLSKLAGECVARQAQSHAVIRFTSIIGVGMRPGSFIPSAIEGARKGCIHLRGDGSRRQNYVNVQDAARMCIDAATMPDSLIGHGLGECSHTNLEVASMLAAMTGASVVTEGVDNSPSYDYARDDFSHQILHRTPLQDTLARMIAA